MQVTINDKNVFGIPSGTLAEVISEEENGSIWVNVNGKKNYLVPWEYDNNEYCFDKKHKKILSNDGIVRCLDCNLSKISAEHQIKSPKI